MCGGRIPVGQGYTYAHLAEDGPITLTLVPSILHNVTVNTAGTSVTVADGFNTIAVIGATTGTFTYDVNISNSLEIGVAGGADVTVTYAT